MADRVTISGALLVRNWLLSISGQALPLLVGLASMPAIVHGLGTERFGLLALSWTLLSAFVVFDVGIGRALTRFTADALGSGDTGKIPGLVRPAVMGQVMLGALGGGVLAAAAGPLITRFLNVAPQFYAEAIRALQIVGLSLPVVLVSISFQGILEAAQRFDVLAGIRSVSGTAAFLIPLAGVFFSWDLPGIMLALLVVRAFLLGVAFVACTRIVSNLNAPIRLERRRLRALLTFGAWVTVSGIAGWVLSLADRLVIGNQLTMTALAHYTIPQDLVTRLGLASASTAMVLFPAFSTLGGAGDQERLRLLFGRSTKLAVLAGVPAFGLLAVLAPDILGVWLGPALAKHSAPVLRVLAAGAGLQLVAAAAYVLLQGLGRADLTAKFHLAGTPLYLAALWWFVRLVGIQGAAYAWSGRFVLEVFLLFWAVGRMGFWTWQDVRKAGTRVALPVAVFCAASALCYSLPAPLASRGAGIGVLLVAFCWWAWHRSLEPTERRWLIEVLSGWRRATAETYR